MHEIDRIIQICCECRICIRECEFLAKVCQTPKEIAERLKAGFFKEKPQIPYSCNLCGLCEELCPHDLNIGKMCLELREQLVRDGLAPLRGHRLVLRDLERSLSTDFHLMFPASKISRCQRVFFPGCNLSAYSPSIVIKTYEYLLKRLPDTGIILGCCGAPAYCLGEKALFQEILARLEAEIGALGASEIVLACPECYHTLKHFISQFRFKTIYEVMVEEGLPETTEIDDWIFSLHDPCTARWEKDLQDSVRTLVKKAGYKIEEMEYNRDKTRCCGMGGLVLYTDFDLAMKIVKRRTDEAPFDILTYCAGCREAFALYKPSIHVLDLIFNPDWKDNRLKSPNKASMRRDNQLQIKSQLEKMYSGLNSK